jgi:hypothetical protein
MKAEKKISCVRLSTVGTLESARWTTLAMYQFITGIPIPSRNRQRLWDLNLAPHESNKKTVVASFWISICFFLSYSNVKMRSISSRCSKKERSISSLAKLRKFDDIVAKLKSKDSEALSSWFGIVPSSSATTDDDNTAVCSLVLHQIIPHHPPVAVVQILLEKMKEVKNGYIPEAAVDEKNQTVLHIAVAVGCDIDVIKCLTMTSDVPAFTMDYSGRFPLHIACSTSPRRGRGMMSNNVLIINHLLEIYPQAVIVPDLSGKTPLQHVQNRGTIVADKRIILTLKMVQHLLSKSSTPSVTKTSSSTTDEISDDVHRLVSNYISTSCAILDDDISSVGSRGVSRSRRHPTETLDHCEV